MADIHTKKEEVETWTEDEVFDFMTEHSSEEVTSKFKGKPSWVRVRCSIYEFMLKIFFLFKHKE